MPTAGCTPEHSRGRSMRRSACCDVAPTAMSFGLARLEETNLVRGGIQHGDFLTDAPRLDPRVHERVALAVKLAMESCDGVNLDHDRGSWCPVARMRREVKRDRAAGHPHVDRPIALAFLPVELEPEIVDI